MALAEQEGYGDIKVGSGGAMLLLEEKDWFWMCKVDTGGSMLVMGEQG